MRLRRPVRFIPGNVDQVSADVDDELSFHLELRARELVDAGLSPDEALARARQEFGDLEFTRWYCRSQGAGMARDERRKGTVDAMLQDLKYAWRALIKAPKFAALATLCLALGIGANTAIFSVIHGVLFRPLPYADPDRLFVLWTDLPGFGHEVASMPDFLDWRRSQSFADMAAAWQINVNVTSGGEPERVIAARITSNVLPVLGVRPPLGRAFVAGEEGPAAPRVAIVSDGFWRRRFGGAPAVVGTTMEINAVAHEIVGVAPPGFAFPGTADLWLPLNVDPAATGRRADFLYVVGRAKPGVEEAVLQDEMTAIARRLDEQYPNTNRGVGIDVVGLREEIVGDARPTLLALWAAAGFLLLIACANVASLLLSRAAARSREIAVRAALGAGRARMVMQLLAESLLLASVAGALGIALAHLAIRALLALQPAHLPRLDAIELDGRVLLFTVIASLVTGLLFGLVPALQASKTDLQGALKDGGRGAGEGPRQRRMRSLLVIVETALAVVLLIGAGLMIRSVLRLQQVDTGVRTHELLTMRFTLTPARYPGADQVRGFTDELVTRVRALPAVRNAGVVNAMYFDNASLPIVTFDVEGAPPPSPGDTPDAHMRAFSPGMLEMFGMRVLQGRTLTARDGARDQRVALVNETMIRRHFGGQNPLGRRIRPHVGDEYYEIIGTVADVRQQGPAEDIYPEVIMPVAQFTARSFSIVVDTAADAEAVTGAIRSTVRALDPYQPLYAVRTMGELMGERIARPRFTMLLLLVFATTAASLAAIGLYGLISYSVSRRQHEVGVRMALGAGPRDISRMVLKQGLALTAIGLVIGVAGALALTRWMATLLFQTSAVDPVTYAAIALALIVVALAASYVPARRAMRTEPVEALRQ